MAVNKDKMLALWYPFTKDWTNQGVDNSALLSSSNATIVSGGKLGKCLLITGAGTSKTFTKLLNLTKFSIALWIRNDATSGYGDWADVIQLIATQTNGYTNNTANTTFRIERSNAANPNNYSCYFNYYQNGTNASTGAATYTACSAGTTIALNTWKHIVMTFDGTTGKIYFDGGTPTSIKFSDRKVTNYKLNGNVTIGAESNPKSSINDFRIYTYALSDQEVKELAKGKVCHYPLDELDFKMPNLCTNTSFDNTTGWFSVNGSTLSTTTLDGFKCLTATKGSSNNLFGTGSYLSYTSGNTDIYAVTMRVYSSETLTFSGSCMLSTSSASGWQSFTLKTIESSNFSLKVGWNTIKWVFSIYHASYSGSPQIFFGATGTTYKITNVNIQKYNLTSNSICYDISGNHYDLTPTGNIYLTNGGKRYKYQILLDYLKTGRTTMVTPQINSQPPFTISFWIKSPLSPKDTTVLWPTFIRYTGSNYSGFNIYRDLGSATDTIDFLIGNGTKWSYGTICNGSNWHHIVLVFTQAKRIIYLDGVPKINSDYVYAPVNLLMVLGHTTSTNVLVTFSDFRIYATALSEADIKELYALGN